MNALYLPGPGPYFAKIVGFLRPKEYFGPSLVTLEGCSYAPGPGANTLRRPLLLPDPNLL